MGKGLRGGVRQRLGLDKASLKRGKSELGGFLVRAYLRGSLTSHDLQEGARSAGSSAPELQRLAKAKQRARVRRGKINADTRNACRAATRFLRSRAILTQPMNIDAPLWDNLKNMRVMGKIAVLPIHETLDALVREGTEEEYASCDKSQASLRSDLRDWASRVGAVLAGVWFMLALWGDAAPLSKRESLYLLTYRVLSGVHRQRLWIAAISKRSLCQCGCFGRCTFDAIFDHVSWSCLALVAGKWPSVDHLGRPLTGWRAEKAGTPLRFRAAVIAKCGDWSWHKQILGMRAWNEGLMCWLCQQRLDDYDFSLTAPWRRTQRCMRGFNASLLIDGAHASNIFALPGFLLEYIKPDWMHCVCLGILQYLLGNVMWELFTEVGGVFSRSQEACAVLLATARMTAKKLGLDAPFNVLTVTMIKPSTKKRPRMKLKATEGRNFLPILTTMLVECFPHSSERLELRLRCCQSLCRCYYELRNWCSVESPARLELSARQHLLLYKELGGDNERYWHIYPKHHMFLHVSIATTNPALMWNYSDEDEIGRAAKLAGKCNVAWLNTGLLQRYRVQFERAPASEQ